MRNIEAHTERKAKAEKLRPKRETEAGANAQRWGNDKGDREEGQREPSCRKRAKKEGGGESKNVNMNIIRSEISKVEMIWVQLNIHIM